ncbi:extracellular calcium-sensing receptor-like [Sphaeramia orbicularis]|uniref:extracellular calcium-sensing receptor-like n=1 Tax=Sphaeramia orbicularis TaxID=375764 RepID=UPI00118140D7|nr:extracellular calcium-sensing receptor-like [Sphaeramia orbicularis]
MPFSDHISSSLPCLPEFTALLHLSQFPATLTSPQSATSMFYFLCLSTRWSSSSFPLLLLTLLSRQIGLEGVQGSVCSRWETHDNNKGLSQDGDVIIGGLFNLNYLLSFTEQDFTKKPYFEPCTGLNILPSKLMYAMTFAVEEINRNSTLLQGVKLGYRILDSWGQSAPLIIGPGFSSMGVILSRILGPLSVPLISYSATCPCLSDRHKFPNFFRTIPSDIYQARAIARLVFHFKWTWIGAVIANDDYGHSALQVFQEEIQGKRICLEFIETVRWETIMDDVKKTAITIQASTARVILIFCWYIGVIPLFLELTEKNVTDRQFLASEAWSTRDALLQNLAISKVASGVVGVAIRSSPIPGFEHYLRSLNPYNHPNDVFVRELWEKEFGGTESLKEVQSVFTDVSQLRWTYNVYLAVYAAAHALHSLLSCPNRDSPTNNSSTCSSAKHIKPRELLQQLNKLNISTPHGEMFYFQGADIPAKFDIVNWQKTPEGSLKLVLVGYVDEFNVHLNESVIQWNTGSSEVPVSVCSKSCPPGTRMANRKGEPVCCFDCIPCGEGEISNITGSLHCKSCPSEFWSNTERTVCIRRQMDFLSFNETLGITLTTVAVSGVIVTTAVFVVFLYYRQTPMVRANNSELSFLLLLSLKLCFLCSLVFIGRPSVWSCRFQQAAFGISFVLCVSCLLVKTMVVLAAFRSARPGAAALMKWFGPGLQRGSVCLFTSVQIIICIIWLSISPPVPHRDLGIQGSKVTLKCAMASVVGFSLVLGYIGLLACSCLLLAFLARKLPDNFNEAKLITFSMLIFCAVWVAFVPAYVSSPGKYVVAVEIFAILASSYGLLFCIFAPKCFIILLRPEKNTKKHLMGR